jgi:hypothetical protein
VVAWLAARDNHKYASWGRKMRADEFDAGYYTPSDDKFNQAHLHDTRRPRLTLIQLNKLKKMRAAKDLEDLVHADHLEIQYAPMEEGPPA